MSRKENRKRKYHILRNAGFTGKEATQYKDLTLEKIYKLAEKKKIMDEAIEKQKLLYEKEMETVRYGKISR